MASTAGLRSVARHGQVNPQAQESPISQRRPSRTEPRRPFPPNARTVAARVLVAVEGGEARSGDTLAREMAAGSLADPRDRGLATELVYGVLRWQRQLDHVLRPRVKQGLTRLEPMARALLRLGAYQILHLDRIPAPIAVSATQDAARAAGAGRLTGLLNGVLRRVAESGFPTPEGGSDGAIGLRTSLPNWIVAALRERYGQKALETEAAALRTRAATTVRPTLGRGGLEALQAAFESEAFEAVAGSHGTAILTGPGDPFATKAFGDGLFVPQDPASLHIIDLMGIEPGMRVLDLCAGRGIKATALADRGAEVVAADVDGRKLQAAEALANKLGLAGRITTRQADATSADLDFGRFDRVLVDAPCTGLGTLRRHPEIAWRRRPEDVHRMARLQADLLRTGARHVAPGGRLIYAVCTFTTAEGPPKTLEGFDETLAATTRPSDGLDAFQAKAWTPR